MNTYIYLYRMTSDTGNAQCVYTGKTNKFEISNMLTLACCKGGQIRYYKNGLAKPVHTGLRHTIGKRHKESIKNKTDRVIVVGIYKNKIMYVADISEIITMYEYFSNQKYEDRKDYIYSVLNCTQSNVDTKSDTQYFLQRNKNNLFFHSPPLGLDKKTDDELIAQHHRDELGEFVLISKKFSYDDGYSQLEKYFEPLLSPQYISKFPLCCSSQIILGMI